ncbi:MAG: hypothetical protein J6V44_09600 [Methanobrevibacter sp.]|nr:hypothetical protein [Methanobrevibacter sp.]
MKKLFYGPEVVIHFKTGTKLRVMTTEYFFQDFVAEFKDEELSSFAIRDCLEDKLYFISKQHVLCIEVIREE